MSWGGRYQNLELLKGLKFVEMDTVDKEAALKKISQIYIQILLTLWLSSTVYAHSKTQSGPVENYF